MCFRWMIKATSLICLATGLTLSAPGIGSQAQAADKIKLVFTSTPSTTAFYLWAAQHMQEISKNSNLDITVQEAGGTEESMYRVQEGSADLGLVDSVIAKTKWGADTNVRFLANGNPAVWQIFVAEDAGIKTLRDLDGKKFSPGSSGGGSTKMTQEILKRLKISPVEFEGTLNDALDAFVDGQIDGLSFRGNGTNAIGGVVEANASRSVRLIPFSPEEIKVAQELYPFLSQTDVVANVYPNQPEPVPSLGSWQVQVAANKNIPEEVVYEFLVKYFEAIPTVAKTQPAVGLVTLENSSAEKIIPMHPGAVRFYREKGFTIPDEAIPPEMKN